MPQNGITLDTVLKPGQMVEIIISYTVRAKVDIAEYLRESGDSDITVEEFQADIDDNFDIHTVLDEWDGQVEEGISETVDITDK